MLNVKLINRGAEGELLLTGRLDAEMEVFEVTGFAGMFQFI